jgi:hypothetical protein
MTEADLLVMKAIVPRKRVKATPKGTQSQRVVIETPSSRSASRRAELSLSLERRGKSGRFGAIAEITPVFEYILSYYEQCVKAYQAVDYNAHDEAPEDHLSLAINLRAAWAKISEYYAKLDDLRAYYAATILHLYYCRAAKDQPINLSTA